MNEILEQRATIELQTLINIAQLLSNRIAAAM